MRLLFTNLRRGARRRIKGLEAEGLLPTAIIGNQAGRHPGERREGDMAKTASISMEIGSGIKERAMAVLKARGMSLSGAVRRMVALGILEHRIPFEVTRDPVFAGAGMTDGLAKRRGIDKEAPARTGRPHRHGGEDGAGVQARDEAVLLRHVRDAQRPRAHAPGAGRLRAARAVRRLRGARHLESHRPLPRARTENQGRFRPCRDNGGRRLARPANRPRKPPRRDEGMRRLYNQASAKTKRRPVWRRLP